MGAGSTHITAGVNGSWIMLNNCLTESDLSMGSSLRDHVVLKLETDLGTS